MYYNVRELKEKLEEKILGLNIDPRFKKNPAFSSALSNIQSLLMQMNMFEADKTTMVKEEDGVISFEWDSTDYKYSIKISSTSPDTFKCIRTEEKKPYINTSGQLIREKSVIEEVASIDDIGWITLTTNGSLVDNTDCKYGTCNNTPWAEIKKYNQNGIMVEREIKNLPTGPLTVDIEKAEPYAMLYLPRQAFKIGNNIQYERRTLLRRIKLDTARLISEDKTKGIQYSAMTELNQEHSLRNMVLPNSDPYQQNVVITPLTPEEIEEIIKKEENPQVAEGLRALAVGREKYYYNSAEDNSFTCIGVEQSKGISK